MQQEPIEHIRLYYRDRVSPTCRREYKHIDAGLYWHPARHVELIAKQPQMFDLAEGDLHRPPE